MSKNVVLLSDGTGNSSSKLFTTNVWRLYQALDLPLAARWNIADYEIRQLGATADGAAAGNLVGRASISNNAARDQPLPMLRVVMQDGRIVTTDPPEMAPLLPDIRS